MGGSLLSPFVVQLSLQMINFQLQGPSILLMREVAPISGLTPASVASMYTNLPVPSSLKIDKMVMTPEMVLREVAPMDSAWFGPEPTIVGR